MHIPIFSSGRGASRALRQERGMLLSELNHTKTMMHQAYSSFNSASDRDLIESYVYEINSLQSRYNYLLRQIKKLEDPS